MAHQLDMTTGKASIAYVGEKPWHGLGQELTPNASLETWKKEAGMDWQIRTSPIVFENQHGTQVYKGQRILYRSDTGDQLSIVGDSYKIVQPEEVLEFFRDLVESQGMQLNTAGVLYGGRRFWALADTGRAFDVLQRDRVKGMLLLTTSCDGTLATTAMFTSVRVVCNNTLGVALNNSQNRVRVTHSQKFDARDVKEKLGLIDTAWENFYDKIKVLVNTKVSDNDAQNFVRKLLERPDRDAEIMSRYHNGMGSELAKGTMWGVVNAVTEFADHASRARIADHRLWGSWFGKEAALKKKAFEAALEAA